MENWRRSDMSQSRATRPQCRSVAAVTFFARSPAKSGESRNCAWFVRSRTTEGTSGEFSQGCAHVRRASSAGYWFLGVSN